MAIITIAGGFTDLAAGSTEQNGSRGAVLSLLERYSDTFNSNGVNNITIENGDNKVVESYGSDAAIDEGRWMTAYITSDTNLRVEITGNDPSALTFFAVLRPV